MKNQKYKLKGEIDRDLKRHKWRMMQIDICGYCFLAMVVMIVLAQIFSLLGVEGF